MFALRKLRDFINKRLKLQRDRRLVALREEGLLRAQGDLIEHINRLKQDKRDLRKSLERTQERLSLFKEKGYFIDHWGDKSRSSRQLIETMIEEIAAILR